MLLKTSSISMTDKGCQEKDTSSIVPCNLRICAISRLCCAFSESQDCDWEEWVMLRIDEQWKVFWDILCWAIRSSLCASTWYLIAVKLYLFMLLGVRLYIIMCLMPSTWKQMNWQSTVETILCCPPPISFTGVSEQSKSLRCWSASHLLLPFSCCLLSYSLHA